MVPNACTIDDIDIHQTLNLSLWQCGGSQDVGIAGRMPCRRQVCVAILDK